MLWFESGAGTDVLEQSEETKLQCVVRTSADPPDAVRVHIVSSITNTPQLCPQRVLVASSLHLV